MECLRRRTLASVFLLLSPHSFLCQTATNGPPLFKESPKECAVITPTPNPQQINLNPSFNAIFPNLPSSVSRNPCILNNQRIPDYIGPGQPCSSIPQNNAAQPPKSITFAIPSLNTLSQNPCISNFNIPLQTSTVNIKQNPMTANKQGITPAVINISPPKVVSSLSILPSSPISPCPKFDITPAPNSVVSQGIQPKTLLAPNTQNQVVLSSQTTSVPTIGSRLNIPSAVIQSQNTQTLPLISNTYSKSCTPPNQPPVCGPSKLSTDLKFNILPTPNLASVATQNCAPVSQAPVQTLVYPKSTVPVDYTTSPILSNCQISTLPPVNPTQKPQPCDNYVTVTKEYNPVPINLQIFMPSPTIPEPQITVITAYPPPPPVPVVPDSSDVSLELFPPYLLPPIIIESKRSKLKSWLPLILIALIANDGCCGGGCCCSTCNCGNSPIPIPYPIPIPTNNPIIVKNATRKKGTKGASSDKKNY